MSLLSNLGKGDMSAALHIGGVAVLGVGSVGAFLYLPPTNTTDLVDFLTTLTFAVGISLLMFGLSSYTSALRQMRQDLLKAMDTLAQASLSPEQREAMARQDAQQMISSITTYIEMEMWGQAFEKANELINKYPKSEEAKKVKPNLEHIKKKATEKPAAGKPAPAAKPAAPAAQK